MGAQPLRSQSTGIARPSARQLLAPLRRAVEMHLAGDHAGAEKRYRAVLALEPEQPQALHHLAVLLHATGRSVEALRCLRQAVELDPGLPGAQARLEALLHDLGR